MNSSRIRKIARLPVMFGCLAWLFSAAAIAQEPSLAGLPGKLAWKNSPLAWHVDAGRELKISAGKKTDWFVDPFDGKAAASAPILLLAPAVGLYSQREGQSCLPREVGRWSFHDLGGRSSLGEAVFRALARQSPNHGHSCDARLVRRLQFDSY